MPAAYTISPDEAGQRLDLFCVQQQPAASRSAVQRAIKDGTIVVNGEAVKPKYLLRAGDVVILPELSPATEPTIPPAELSDISLPILYEDADVVVVNKPAGIAMHTGVGSAGATVASWFAARYPASATVGGDPIRPGIVHRLDKDTSGVIILAKTAAAHAFLSEQFAKRRARKEYAALVFGVPGSEDGRITQPLLRSRKNPLRRTIHPTGKPAITEWRRDTHWQGYALLRLHPITGRMHQLRAHLHWLGYPIVGDRLYTIKRQSPPPGVTRHLLHAETLTVVLPNKQQKTFTAPLPDDFAQVVESLGTPLL